MLVLYRKSGQGIYVSDGIESYKIKFLFNRNGMTHYQINEEEKIKSEGDPFYLDSKKTIMVIIFQSHNAIRIGVDAPEKFKIKRMELS